MKRQSFIVLMVLFFTIGIAAGCSNSANEPVQGQDKPGNTPDKTNGMIRLATTTSTKDSGLLDQLIPAFTQKYGIEVQVLAQGTGQAIKTGEMGDVDVILVHARSAEDQFVAEKHGVNRRDVMYNDFVVLGPADDPAGIKGMDVTNAMKKLSEGKAKFISRGDDSGTHKKEKSLWSKAQIKPSGDWYLSVGKGMGDTLIMTNELQAYTLSDRGTYLSMKDKLNLKVLVEGDKLLFNPYGIIAVNPEKHPGVNFQGAMKLIQFITSDEGKKIITEFKVNGEQLFYIDK
ncbi:substrate-binding domain-containing protein [Microaerobacter geothermalis]|uniref:substrate-binding domain-containing protein n=1 Tax=Microaerobacter geothermalis TaxID=674972 RepID=UPI001F2D1818|nr:substrate-binding domain-containing protein [Microaerobacter geothermalis]MCF6092923.1 substrate-binding domain-containing protein [Microaerobacter geothermalis]